MQDRRELTFRVSRLSLHEYYPITSYWSAPVTSVSRVTSKFQATIPLPVRTTLGIKQGDVLAFEIENGLVRLTRASLRDIAFAQAVEGTLCEWDSAADDEAYREL